jgi:hypothetical protein
LLITLNGRNDLVTYNKDKEQFSVKKVELFVLDEDPETVELEKKAKEYLVKEKKITMEEAQIGGYFVMPETPEK